MMSTGNVDGIRCKSGRVSFALIASSWAPMIGAGRLFQMERERNVSICIEREQAANGWLT